MQYITSLFCTFFFLISLSLCTIEVIPTWCFLAITPMVIYWAHLLEPTSNFLAAILGYTWRSRIPICPFLAPITIPIQTFVVCLVALNALTVVLHHFNVWAKLFPHKVVFPKDPNAMKFALNLSYPFPTVSWSTNNITTNKLSLTALESKWSVNKESSSSESSVASSSSASEQLTTPRDGKAYRPPCDKCGKWHKRGEKMCEISFPIPVLERAKDADNLLRTWLDIQCRLFVDPKRTRVVSSFLNSAYAQVHLASKIRTLSYPQNASLHSKSTIVEDLISRDEQFRFDLHELYLQELRCYQGIPYHQIESPLKTFRLPSLRI